MKNINKAGLVAAINALCISLLGVFAVVFFPIIPMMVHETVEFYTTVPSEQLLGNVGVLNAEEIQGEEYRQQVCENWNYVGAPEWMLWEDRPSYCGGE